VDRRDSTFCSRAFSLMSFSLDCMPNILNHTNIPVQSKTYHREAMMGDTYRQREGAILPSREDAFLRGSRTSLFVSDTPPRANPLVNLACSSKRRIVTWTLVIWCFSPSSPQCLSSFSRMVWLNPLTCRVDACEPAAAASQRPAEEGSRS